MAEMLFQSAGKVLYKAGGSSISGRSSATCPHLYAGQAPSVGSAMLHLGRVATVERQASLYLTM